MSFSAERSAAPQLMLSEFSLNQYDVIGFDLDHTICKYKLNPLFDLIYSSLASFICAQYNFPESVLEKKPHDDHFIQKGIILDKSRGNFLKLDQNYRIEKACHGTRIMSEEEVLAVYGNDKFWIDSKGIPDKLCTDASLEQPFYVFKDYFVTPGALVCAKTVDALDAQNKGPLPSYSFWKHYLNGLFYMYERSNFKTDAGFFFPNLKNNRSSYLEPCSDQVKEWLKSIRQVKKTFLITSANFDSASFIAEFCLGTDWRDYFDVIITFARKPGFFTKLNPFYIIQNDAEGPEVSADQIQPHVIYSQGNWKQLQNALRILSGVDQPKALYVGDSVVEDIYASSERGGCDTIAIVEEMVAEGVSLSVNRKEIDLLQSDLWGSFFISESDSHRNLSLWASILQRHSKLIIPSVETLSTLGLFDKISSFSLDCPTGGYFPTVPASLNR